ncbi:MAG TPA: sigma-70 family RNA polymerase sigma factor [Spirochaetota bacterium]|nr:sigma-70 family RNA polymerase sigma factor [Spirochaetota bacterium]HOS38997.1 sigma-70 family RNA polymerase sigma factor [Spirochaetota bacterium]HPU87564.1 sigma-70 family RNA polymerase sigma factor [Spirochaetota bacterium]
MLAKLRDRFTETHSQYYPLVFSAVHTKVDNVDDAHDICQEVFIKLYEKFDSVENPRKWLYGALRLAVFEYYRRRDPGTDIDDVFNDVSLTFVNGFRDARIVIAEAMEDMVHFDGEEDKTLFDLIAVHNFSYSQTAKQLGLTKRMVEYRYRRIVESILDALKKKGVGHIEDLL